MATKKKQNTTAKRGVRLCKAKQCLRFHADILTALQDLQSIGVEFTE